MAYNRIEIPSLVREPLPWNILAVAKDVTPPDERWASGVVWESGEVPLPRTWDPLAEDPGEKNLDPDGTDNGSATVVAVYLPYVCSTSGPFRDSDTTRAKARLEAATAYGVEAALWSVAAPLAQPAGITGSSGEVVAKMGQMLAEVTPGKGVFNLPSWSAEMYLRRSGWDPSGPNAPRTNRGDDVVVGAGYPNVGTLGESQTILATGPVGYLLSDIEVYETDSYVTSENLRVLLAERFVAIQIDTDPVLSGTISTTITNAGG